MFDFSLTSNIAYGTELIDETEKSVGGFNVVLLEKCYADNLVVPFDVVAKPS